MPRVKKCVLCAKKGKDVPVCPNNGTYCHFHMWYETEIYSLKKGMYIPVKPKEET